MTDRLTPHEHLTTHPTTKEGRMTPTAIDHRPTCREPHMTVRAVGQLGDTLEKCTSCARWRVVADDEPDDPEPTPLVTHYRCRDHDAPVTWRGRGCPSCSRALGRRGRKRKRRTETPTPGEPLWTI